MVSNKLKKIVFKKLYNDLKDIEVIPYDGSLWFIDRKTKNWYFEFKEGGVLFWRYSLFSSFFSFFSLESNVYPKILGEWVEEVLNCKVDKNSIYTCEGKHLVHEVLLNYKVNEVIRQRFSVSESVGGALKIEKYYTFTYNS